MLLYIILSLAFLTASLFAFSAAKLISPDKRTISRLHGYINVPGRTQEIRQTGKRDFAKNLANTGARIGGMSVFTRYRIYAQGLLQMAYIPMKGEEFISISLGILVGFTVILLVLSKNILLCLLLGWIGWFLPLVFLKIKIKKRVKLFNDQLGDAIALMSNSMKAGYSFFQAVDTVSGEMSGCMAEEFTRLKREINLGITTEQALENLIKRIRSDDLELLVTAVLIQRQVGGNLSEILDNISGTIRERIRIKGEVKAITAQGRMSGMVIGLLPPAMCGVLLLINHSYMMLLFTTPLGLMMVGVGVVSELLGMLLISKIVKIQV